ncbi:MAG: J domain-containing protein [Spirulina sp. SIO3F2]|nr:J domain-containing protein [Spirulina sp. SIO3F2]
MVAGRQNFRDYYQILEISDQAAPEEIKRSFRRLARRYHPDMNPGDKVAEDKFKDINEAYEILSDEGRRSQYDRFKDAFNTMNRRKPKRNGNRAADRDFQDFDRFVEDLLNREPERGDRIDPKSPHAYDGPRTIKTERPPRSKASSPKSKKSATATKAEPRSSYRLERKRDVEARLSLPLEKAFNGGRERIRLEDGRSLEVDMPPGMRDGQKIRLRNQGINSGDLYLKISVEPHARFEVRGNDVFCQVPITPTEAVLGGPVEVPTLNGLVKMNVPPGIKMGQRLRLANKGFPSEDEQRGDQLVELQITIPTTLTPEEKELYQKLRAIESFTPRKDLLS